MRDASPTPTGEARVPFTRKFEDCGGNGEEVLGSVPSAQLPVGSGERPCPSGDEHPAATRASGKEGSSPRPGPNSLAPHAAVLVGAGGRGWEAGCGSQDASGRGRGFLPVGAAREAAPSSAGSDTHDSVATRTVRLGERHSPLR